MVSAEHPTCSAIGADILRANGSAVDATIASALCIGVVHNFSSGIGGGGFVLVRNSTDQASLIDFREEAPAAATTDMYKDDIALAQVGGLAVAIPGEIRGFEAAHRQYGRLPWSELFAPAVRLARDGFVVDEILGLILELKKDRILNDPGFRESYTVLERSITTVHHPGDGNGDDDPPAIRVARKGDTIFRKRLADTLEAVATHGADIFYKGPLAESMARAAQAAGGIITAADFAQYEAQTREVLRSTYHGHTVVTSPPPTSGSILILLLNILEGLPFSEEGNTPLNYHRLIEAFKYAYAQRTVLGDPAFVALTNHTAKMLNSSYAEQLRRNISDAQTFPPMHYNPTYDVQEPHGTTHISVVDKYGQAASMTTTVNLVFGSEVMDPYSGVILNNEMDDFSTQNKSNAFGYFPSPNNKILPGKRPLSSSVPVILEKDGKVTFVAGASGGSRIISAVVQVMINALQFDMPLAKAVDHSRLHHQLMPNEIRVEQGNDPELVKYLENKGHQTVPYRMFESSVQAIYAFPNGTLLGVSDNRKRGLAEAE
ncbi:gamma-glutamyltranspeptidase [Dimargaris cristalligena]|uniref:Gamma-glutamyltranspeptidase n=1 Tax=Dimargaris cristalligena TaxID=215637 RepID=A0A4P9ZNK5_9FUNG|nr:gamma-glutamyltranspeptidase [Dimargaris cristalligena]|eukprot:RKP35006.1 gamma-glutamyltranspeptidase [Dimargaris cristalligena]